MPRLNQIWSTLSSFDEAEIARFTKLIEPLMGAVKQTAVSVSSGYLSTVTGLPQVGVAANVVESVFDAREPFISIWQALDSGVPYEEAVEAGRKRAESMVRTYMSSTARRTGDHYLQAAGARSTLWRRVPDGKACSWCLKVAHDHYKSSESADFGHRNCGCSVLPSVNDFDPAPVAVQAIEEAPVVSTSTTALPQPVIREHGGVLSDEQYKELKPGWNLPKQKRVIAALRSTPEGKLLHDTLKGFQSGSSRQIPLLRTNIEKRLTGAALDPGAAKRVDNLLAAMKDAPFEPPNLFRGIRLDGTADEIVARYTSSDTLDLNLSSFSSDKKLAKDFTIKGAGQKGPRSKTQTGVLIEMDGGAGVKALPIENISPSRIFANEKEWLSGGRFSVESVTKAKDGTVVIRLRQLAALGD